MKTMIKKKKKQKPQAKANHSTCGFVANKKSPINVKILEFQYPMKVFLKFPELEYTIEATLILPE